MWESPSTGAVWGLVLHETLYFGDRLQGSLLCPNQVRAAGHKVQDVPVQFDATSRHSISVPGRIELPMELHGVISYLSTRKPTDEEIQRYHDGTLQTVELTDNTPPWEPYSSRFAESEKAARASPLVSAVRVTIPRPNIPTVRSTESEEEDEPAFHRFQRPPILDERELAVTSRLEVSQSLIELIDDDELATRVVASVNIESESDENGKGSSPTCIGCAEVKGCRCAAKIATKDRGPVITKEILARRWGIGLDTAHRTLTATTQVGVRKVLHPVERRYRTRQAHLRFPTLNTRMYTDTMFAAVKSLRGNKCAQVFTNGIG